MFDFMDNLSGLPLDIRLACRICLHLAPAADESMAEKPSLQPIQQTFKTNSTEMFIKTLISECTSINITEDVRLPGNVCTECLNKLNFIYEFRRQVELSEKYLLMTYLTELIAPDSDIAQTNNNNSQYPLMRANNERCILLKDISEMCTETLESQYVESVPVERRSNGFPRHECPVCRKVFPSSKLRIKHLTNKHSVPNNQNVFKPHHCTHEHCEKSYTTLANLTAHSAQHTGIRPFKCSVCERGFLKKVSLTNHMTIHTGERQHKCGGCDRTFTSSSILQQHEKTHSSVRPYQCSLCLRGFHTSNDLRVHSRTHTGERPYLCSICGRGFSRVTHLNTHTRTHSGEKPYACTTCSKAFSQSGDLKAHIRTHTGEKPYGCTICEKRFNQSSGLTAHIKSHTGERNYVCEVCHKSFTQSSSLARHIKCHS